MRSDPTIRNEYGTTTKPYGGLSQTETSYHCLATRQLVRRRTKYRLKAFLFLVVAYPIFEYVVQPLLIVIHPMFKDHPVQYENIRGPAPQTPAGWAFLATVAVLICIYVVFIESPDV